MSMRSEAKFVETEEPRVRRTQAERSAESDRRMLRAALKLIGERGYRGTSLAAIGEEAGYSRGLVNERFGSKSGLLWVLVKHMMAVWTEFGRPGQGSSSTPVGIEALCEILDNHRRAVERDDCLRSFYALMFEALGPIPELLPEFQKLHRDFRTALERQMREGIEAGVVRSDIDPAAQATILLGALRGIGFQWLLDRDSIALESAYSELKRDLRRSLAP